MKFGQPRGKGGEVGILVSIDLSMNGRWKKWKGCFDVLRGRRLGWMRRIGWGGWTLKDGVFSIKSLYRALQPVSLASFLSKIIWNSCVRPKLSFFVWEASWGRVLTLDRLQKRGWALANRCFLCQTCEESIDHLLIHCEKTREVWMLLLSFFGVSWVFPLSVKETF